MTLKFPFAKSRNSFGGMKEVGAPLSSLHLHKDVRMVLNFGGANAAVQIRELVSLKSHYPAASSVLFYYL